VRRVLPIAALVLAVAAAPALGAVGSVARSDFGFTAVSAAAPGQGAVAVWGGEVRTASAVAAERPARSAPWTFTALGTGGSVIETDVAANARGDVVAVWIDLGFTAGPPVVRVLGSRRGASGTWGPPQAIAEYPDPQRLLPTFLPARAADV
jgi:hypothetical protein